jgi:hypothetical protein
MTKGTHNHRKSKTHANPFCFTPPDIDSLALVDSRPTTTPPAESIFRSNGPHIAVPFVAFPNFAVFWYPSSKLNAFAN